MGAISGYGLHPWPLTFAVASDLPPAVLAMGVLPLLEAVEMGQGVTGR